jgi:hypothetical protein
VITPRRTRLIRVADLHEFRRAITALLTRPVEEGEPLATGGDLSSRLVVVPTRGAARLKAARIAWSRATSCTTRCTPGSRRHRAG